MSKVASTLVITTAYHHCPVFSQLRSSEPSTTVGSVWLGAPCVDTCCNGPEASLQGVISAPATRRELKLRRTASCGDLPPASTARSSSRAVEVAAFIRAAESCFACLTAATSRRITCTHAPLVASPEHRSGYIRAAQPAAVMEVPPPAHVGPDGWLAVPSLGRIVNFGLLVLALLVFYEQVKMFLYRHASSPSCTCCNAPSRCIRNRTLLQPSC